MEYLVVELVSPHCSVDTVVCLLLVSKDTHTLVTGKGFISSLYSRIFSLLPPCNQTLLQSSWSDLGENKSLSTLVPLLDKLYFTKRTRRYTPSTYNYLQQAILCQQTDIAESVISYDNDLIPFFRYQRRHVPSLFTTVGKVGDTNNVLYIVKVFGSSYIPHSLVGAAEENNFPFFKWIYEDSMSGLERWKVAEVDDCVNDILTHFFTKDNQEALCYLFLNLDKVCARATILEGAVNNKLDQVLSLVDRWLVDYFLCRAMMLAISDHPTWLWVKRKMDTIPCPVIRPDEGIPQVMLNVVEYNRNTGHRRQATWDTTHHFVMVYVEDMGHIVVGVADSEDSDLYPLTEGQAKLALSMGKCCTK
jgi:hypothetical protein